jgi:hypothetical protein
MLRSLLAGGLVLGLVACTGGAAKEVPKGEPDGGVANTVTAARSLASGTHVDATIQSALSSRTNKSGETVRALVSRNVTDGRGRVVIPAGSTVELTIDKIEPGSSQIRPEGRLSLMVSSVTVDGATYPLSGALDNVAYHLEGRGITKDEAARIGAGTAIGAIAGQVIGKNQKSTVIGGAVGAVAGGAVAVRYAYRDVVVSAGTPIGFTLTQALKLSAR